MINVLLYRTSVWNGPVNTAVMTAVFRKKKHIVVWWMYIVQHVVYAFQTQVDSSCEAFWIVLIVILSAWAAAMGTYKSTHYHVMAKLVLKMLHNQLRTHV